MPGPSSPARAAKQQRAKEKARIKNRNVKKDYVPAESSLVRQLPHSLTAAMRAWWDNYGGSGKEFEARKGNRGGQNGAMAWIRDKFVQEWWEEHFPQAKEVSEEDRAWFFAESGMGKLIWGHLSNFKRKEDNQRAKTAAAEGHPQRKNAKAKTRAIGHDVYRNEHPKEYKKEYESFAAYQKLPNQKKKYFKDKAVTLVKESQQLTKIADPEERIKLMQAFWKSLRGQMKEWSEFLGIEVCALVVHETEDGKTRVTREISEGIKGFSNSTRLAKAMDELKEYLEAMSKGPANNSYPSPWVYPDFAKDGYPCLPNFRGWSVRRMKKLLRAFIKAVFKFQGGVGRMIWQEIKGALHRWIDPQRLPKVEDLVWNDPAFLTKEMVIIWLNFLVACQTGAIPPEQRFQFLRVPAGPTPIHPSDSQETGRESEEGESGYILVFENEVTKCHRVGGMTYDPRSIDYASLVSFGREHANAASIAPLRWLCLPTPSSQIPTSAFFGAELIRLTDWASNLEETAKVRVMTMIEVTNTYQAHLPASHPIGVWLREGGIPLVLPRSPQEASNPASSFWLPRNSFLPPGLAAVEGMMYFFEIFQDEMREGDIILHKPSNTFYGGPTGIVCITRPLIQIYINCLAIRGDFHPPEPAPAGYDLSRFNVSDHDRIVNWMDKWAAAIKQHTKVLAETYPERKSGLSSSNVRPTSADSEGELSDDFDAGSEPDDTPAIPPLPSSTIPSTSTDNLSVPGPSKRSKGKKPMRARSFADYDDDSDEDWVQDYEAIDQTSQDDQSSDEDDLNLFNEKHLDDDIFPPGDSIGMGERYGISLVVPFHLHIACAPYEQALEEDTTHAANVKSGLEPLFGGFPVLEPYRAARLSRPDTIMRQLIALAVEAKRAWDSWEYYNRENPRLTPELRKWSKTESLLFPEPLQPLIRLLFTRLASWLRAKAMAPHVYAHWLAMAYILREALDLFETADRLLGAKNFPDSEFTAEDLTHQVMKTKHEVVELSCICAELKEWHKLTTKFVGELGGNWIIQRIPVLGEVINIVEGTLEWTRETAKLGNKQVEDRPRKWAKILDTPCRAPRALTNYLFGSPTQLEAPEDQLLDALEHARTMNPHLSLIDDESGTFLALDMILPKPRQDTSSKTSIVNPAPTSTSESPLEPPTIPTSPQALEGQRMDVDMPGPISVEPSTSNLPLPQPIASPDRSASTRVRPKMRPVPSSQSVPAVDLAPRVEPTPTVEPNPTVEPTPTIEPAPGVESTPPAENTDEATGAMNLDRSATVTSDPPVPSPSPLPEPQRISARNTEHNSSSPPFSPPPTPAVPETRLTRKRKSAPGTQTESEDGQGKRASARLRAKSGPADVDANPKGAQSARRVSTRSGRK